MHIRYTILLIFFLILIGCDKDLKQITNPSVVADPEFSTVFNHGQGDLCYYPRASNNGRYIAIEREEIVSPPGYVAHIWLYDLNSASICQMTTNPSEGKYDDRNLRFNREDTFIYFLRTHWYEDGTYDQSFCRIPVNGTEQDVELVPDNNMIIYRFDFLPTALKILVAYYNPETKEYYTGLLNLVTSNISVLNYLTGQRHNALVPLPDGSGFIAATGSPGAELSSYKIKSHYFDGRPSHEYSNPQLDYIVWTLSINPAGDKLLVHQGVCTKSKTHCISIVDENPIQILTEYNLPRDVSWGADSYIYFTVNGDVMRYGKID